MSRLGTTFTIVRYSLDIMRKQPRLLAFPVISLLAFALIVVFLLAPVLLGITTAQVWQAFFSEEVRERVFSAWTADPESASGALGKGTFAAFLCYHLFSMFILNVINVAFYSQIIEAMNGSMPSVSRGFALCFGNWQKSPPGPWWLGLKTTSYTFDWVGAQPGRWRVWSVDGRGKRGEKSGWTDFDYSM